MEKGQIVYFCTDLDNTLIYSYKHDIGEKKILVETMNGKALSYMREDSYGLLQMISGSTCIVPVTTRSLEQYKRIDFGSAIRISYALVANGGILLEDGEINQAWFKETKDIVASVDNELEKAISILNGDSYISFEVRKVDGLFVFTKSSSPNETIEKLKSELDENKVYIDSNGNKIYVFPIMLNKGESLKRFKKHVLDESFLIAAGDSEFDISMLNAADMGLCPEELLFNKGRHIKSYDKKNFTQFMLEEVWKKTREI